MKLQVRAPHADGGGYDIVVQRGALHDPGLWLDAAGHADRLLIVADETVARLYGQTLHARLEGAGRSCEIFTFPPGEASKTRAQWARLTDAFLAVGAGRDSCVLALGGGVTGDLAGFVAATFLRGVPVIQLPTTLLAMIDAAIGGKTGVDTEAGKNLVGAFHQPRRVVADPDVLASLPRNVLADGFAEAVKHAAIADADQLGWLRDNARLLAAGDADALLALVGRSAAIKAAIVSDDLHESGRRAILNVGHTVAHALERLTGYGMRHGQAVGIGLVAESTIGERAGITAAGTTAELDATLAALGVERVLPACDTDRLIAAMAGDKKARAGTVRFSLLERAGLAARAPDGAWTFAIAPEIVRDALDNATPRQPTV